jgi:hypothetical protein
MSFQLHKKPNVSKRRQVIDGNQDVGEEVSSPLLDVDLEVKDDSSVLIRLVDHVLEECCGHWHCMPCRSKAHEPSRAPTTCEI